MRVRLANKASAQQLAESVVPTIQVTDGISYALEVKHATELNSSERTRVFDIFAENMHTLYINSSFGWDPPSKMEELFGSDSRFLLVRDPTHELVAFIMFRFDREDGEDIVYCYDIHLSKPVRRKGLGSILLQQLVRIASRWGMKKIMLTVLKANTNARKFYQTIGFRLDPTSPDYVPNVAKWVDEGPVDYEILSLDIS